MSGTTADIIPIVIIPVVVLAFWLIMIFRANSHPQWGSQTPMHATPSIVPAERLSSPGPLVPGQHLGAAASDVLPEGAGQQNPASATT